MRKGDVHWTIRSIDAPSQDTVKRRCPPMPTNRLAEIATSATSNRRVLCSCRRMISEYGKGGSDVTMKTTGGENTLGNILLAAKRTSSDAKNVYFPKEAGNVY